MDTTMLTPATPATPQNRPLYFCDFVGDVSDPHRLQQIIYCSLDAVEEKGEEQGSCRTPAGALVTKLITHPPPISPTQCHQWADPCRAGAMPTSASFTHRWMSGSLGELVAQLLLR